MTRTRFILIDLALILALVIGSSTLVAPAFNSARAAVTKKVSKAKTAAKAVVKAAPRIRNDHYDLQRASAKRKGIKLINTRKDIKGLVAKGKLVSIKDGRGYRIDRLTHSYPFLIKPANEILLKLGADFSKTAGKGSYFTVTSATRTLESQRSLRKRNTNATQNESTHCYGASFDISYVRFNGRRGENRKLQTQLEHQLVALQKAGKIYLTKESKQRCYHVTVR